MEEKKKIEMLVLDCIRRGKEPRRELVWLEEKYQRFAAENRLAGRAQTDALIYKKMYGTKPEKESHVLKIRFWRTGRHLPANREQCISFGQAIDLSESEMKYLLQAYYDRSDRTFSEADSGEKGKEDPLYIERVTFMNSIVEEYLRKVPPSEMMELGIAPWQLRQHLRHLYFMDAVKCIDIWKRLNIKLLRRHISSINYRSELERSLKLIGEIPRKTILRHFILFGKPFINRQILDGWLEKLGYMPLTEGHSMVGEERLDDLVIGFLDLYKKYCTGKGTQECENWLCVNLRYLDRCLIREGEQNLRFMYFKALRDYSPGK